jgi:exonuclease SbcC
VALQALDQQRPSWSRNCAGTSKPKNWRRRNRPLASPRRRTGRSGRRSARHAALALIAVQPARPLADEIRRIDGDIAATQAAIAASTQNQQAARRWTRPTPPSRNRPPASRKRKPPSAPPRRNWIRPRHWMRASKPCCPPIARPQPPAKASQADAAAKAALQSKQNEQARVAAQQQAGVAWLQQHKHWKALALQWERWDVLFVQAGQAAATAERLASGLSRVQRNAQMHRDEEADASAKLAAAVAALQRWTRSASSRAGDGRVFGRGLQASRRSRSSAATCWPARKNLAGTGLASGPPRPDRNAIGAAAAGHDRAEAQVAAAQQEGIAIMAAFSQAERTAAGGSRMRRQRGIAAPVAGRRHALPGLRRARSSISPPRRQPAKHAARIPGRREVPPADGSQRQSASRAPRRASQRRAERLAIEQRSVQQALERARSAWSRTRCCRTAARPCR